ncbi:cytochrome P450 [Phascolomyces articulosus]|uniref:Cytochrome P450 n=1 Tax=Phascolomyces articulosus TaxID=60185 RepID=A0AAD5PLE6_9FUNG|nr:cytochrome P450 [Phascolomyces articulosus]
MVWNWKLRQQHHDHKPQEIKKISGRLPFLGHALQLYRNPTTFLHQCKKEAGPAYRIQLGGFEFYVMTGSLIQDMLYSIRKFDNYDGIQVMMPVDRILNICYRHKYDTDKLITRNKNPVKLAAKKYLKPHTLGIFSNRIQEGIKRVFDVQLNLKPGEKTELDKNGDTMPWILAQVIALCFAGSKLGYNKDLVLATDLFSRKTVQAGMLLSVLPQWMATPFIKHFTSVEKHLDTILDVLMPELEKMKAGEVNHEDEPTLISLVLGMKNSNGELHTPMETAIYYARASLAGLISPRLVVFFILYELACQPSLATELRMEIEKLDELTPEAIGNIKFLDSMVRETLRLKIAPLGMFHKTTTDVVLSTGQIIPRGSLTIGTLLDAHTDPILMKKTSRLGKSPMPLDQFDPYRFVHDEDNSGVQENDADDIDIRSSTSLGPEFLTFGLSSHACPGRHLGTLIVKNVIAEMVMRFNITTKSGKRLPDVNDFGLALFPPEDSLILEKRA